MLFLISRIRAGEPRLHPMGCKPKHWKGIQPAREVEDKKYSEREYLQIHEEKMERMQKANKIEGQADISEYAKMILVAEIWTFLEM